MKRKLGFLLHIFSMVTTCVVIAVAVFTTLVEPSETVDSVVLWQIPVASLFCTLGCLIYPWDKECGKWEMALRIGIHYVYVNGVVLGAGFWFRWYEWERLKSVLSMLFTIAAIFILVSVISWKRSAADARRMNQRLKEYQQKENDRMS